jgi:hypothetical protein
MFVKGRAEKFILFSRCFVGGINFSDIAPPYVTYNHTKHDKFFSVCGGLSLNFFAPVFPSDKSNNFHKTRLKEVKNRKKNDGYRDSDF